MGKRKDAKKVEGTEKRRKKLVSESISEVLALLFTSLGVVKNAMSLVCIKETSIRCDIMVVVKYEQSCRWTRRCE